VIVDSRDAAVIVEKTMTENPSRIKRLSARFSLSLNYSEPTRRKLEAAAKACPVKKSLHPDVEIEMKFFYERWRGGVRRSAPPFSSKIF
jgi:putative redox protein